MDSPTQEVPTDSQILLNKHEKVFEIPKDLSPSLGKYDHGISLIPGSQPPIFFPYRHPFAQKNEEHRVVLRQEGQPLAFTSKHLCDRNLVKSTYEKETMTILHALETWCLYLIGMIFQIKTDHQNLKYFVEKSWLEEVR